MNPLGSMILQTGVRRMLITLIVLQFATSGYAQTDVPLVESEDTHYYDFWPGVWMEVVDGAPDSAASMFTVRRSVGPASFEEDWWLVDDGESHHSRALRAWDQVNGKWMFVWISDNSLFQIWDGVGSHRH